MAMSRLAPYSNHANDGAGRTTSEWHWRRKLRGLELLPESSIRPFARFLSKRQPKAVGTTPCTGKPTATDWEERCRGLHNVRQTIKIQILTESVCMFTKPNSNSRKAPVLEQFGRSSIKTKPEAIGWEPIKKISQVQDHEEHWHQERGWDDRWWKRGSGWHWTFLLTGLEKVFAELRSRLQAQKRIPELYALDLNSVDILLHSINTACNNNIVHEYNTL